MGPEITPSLPDNRPHWNFVERVLFRFSFVYLILYILPFPLQPLQVILGRLPMLLFETHPFPGLVQFLFEKVRQPYENLWNNVVVWTGKHVFDLDITIRPAGSGDTTWNYVQVFCLLVLSAAATLAWSLLDRKRPSYPRLHEGLRVYVRFYVATTMVLYGSVKVIQSQFPSPDADRLLTLYGESSPMRLLWTFMGASQGYNVFTGAGEMLGGLLLCMRRTTLLGALVTFGVMVHVAALNFCYDVPVKLFSTHLVLMAVFLMAPDLPWLARVFLLGRKAEPQEVVPLTRWRWVNGPLVGLRTVLVGAYVGAALLNSYTMSRQFGELAEKPPLHGLWEVEEFALDGQVRPPLTTDGARWQHVIFTRRSFRGTMLATTTMRGEQVYYQVAVDPDSRTVTVSRRAPPNAAKPPENYRLTYRELEPDLIVLEGALETVSDGKPGKRQVRARLRHVGRERFLLLNRGFRWINETPFNRSEPRNPPPKVES